MAVREEPAGRLSAIDWAIPIVMAVASVVMVGLGVQTLATNGVVLVVFGVVGAGLSMLHLRRLRAAPIRGRVRIANHLLWMLSAAIAAVTAFLVVNGPFGLVDWFLPTIVIVPLIVVWRRKVMAGAQTTASRAAVEPPG